MRGEGLQAARHSESRGGPLQPACPEDAQSTAAPKVASLRTFPPKAEFRRQAGHGVCKLQPACRYRAGSQVLPRPRCVVLRPSGRYWWSWG